MYFRYLIPKREFRSRISLSPASHVNVQQQGQDVGQVGGEPGGSSGFFSTGSTGVQHF